MNTDEHKCAPAVSAQPPATCRHAARLGAQQGRRQRQQAGSCQPAGTSVLLFLICSAGLKAQTNAWITQRTTDQTPQCSPSFLLSLFQCRFCMLNKRRQRARLHSVPPGSTALGWSWTFTSSLYVGFVPSPIDTNPRELQSLPI